MSFYTKAKIVLTIIISIIVAFFTYQYLEKLKESSTILITTQDIESHTVIQPDMLQEVEISTRDKDIFGENVVSSKQELENAVSKAKIEKGSVIIKNKDVISGTKEELIDKKVLLENGELNNSYFISENKRIVAVTLDTEGAVKDKLGIGDYVDVIYTNSDDKQNSFSVTIMKHIEIYDCESSTDNMSDSTKDILLIVTPQEAVDITYAKRTGKIDLVLNSVNGQDQDVGICSIRDIIGIGKSNDNENMNNTLEKNN